MKNILRWLPALFLMTLIFVLSSIPSEEMPSFGFWDTLVKKGGHMLGYGVLALALWFAMQWTQKYTWLALFLTVIFALTDEFHQSFVPGRHASLLDALVFDGGGALLSLAIGKLVMKRKS